MSISMINENQKIQLSLVKKHFWKKLKMSKQWYLRTNTKNPIKNQKIQLNLTKKQ